MYIPLAVVAAVAAGMAGFMRLLQWRIGKIKKFKGWDINYDSSAGLESGGSTTHLYP